MTTASEEVELVNYFRSLANVAEPSSYRNRLVASADTIERLVQERDEAREQVKAILQREHEQCLALGLEIKELRNDAEAADAQVAELTKERDEAMDEVDVARLILAQNPRAMAAEAQVAEWVKSENLWKQARDDIAKRCNEAEAQVAVLRNMIRAHYGTLHSLFDNLDRSDFGRVSFASINAADDFEEVIRALEKWNAGEPR